MENVNKKLRDRAKRKDMRGQECCAGGGGYDIHVGGSEIKTKSSQKRARHKNTTR